jgi:hypothetical protein
MPALTHVDHGALLAARCGIHRSPKWKEVKRAHLAKHPQCVACVHPGARVDVHHVFPFHLCILVGRPDLELDERNLVTLCAESNEHGAGDHHLLLGHFDDWDSMNVHVRREAEHAFHGMSAVQIRASAVWRDLAGGRPQHLGELSARERALMDRLMPRR